MAQSPKSSTSTYNSEELILLDCARTRLSSEAAVRVRKIVAAGLDWQILIKGAEAHGVIPLICRHLLGSIADGVPEKVHSTLRVRREAIAQKNLFLAAEMLRLSRRFRAEGLPAVPYKGPLLAAQAYGDFGLRQFADLDFAIRQRDLPRAAALLAADGYSAAFGEITQDEGTHPSHSEYQFVQPGKVLVELQTEETLRYFPRALDFDALGSRLTSVSLAGGEVFSFSPEDTLILLAVHGAKHFWERLLWIADIAELLQTEPGIDWAKAFSRAEEMGVSRMLNLAIYLAHAILQAPLTENVREKVLRDPVVRKLGDGICEQFSISAKAQMPVFARFRFRVASRDSFWAGMRFALRLATSPTEPDRAAMPLPKHLSGIRRWLRPVLLMKRHGIRRTKSNQER